jgi:2-haloalkanoic acid dehalogenase type II
MTERPYDVVTFDCYGTLIDWDTGITKAFEPIAERLGLQALDLRAAYERQERAVESESYRTYRDVLAETSRRAAAALGHEIDDAEATAFAERLPDWRPFADTNPALERLVSAGYSLGILSNTDDDLIAATRRHFAVPFDLVITAQQVGSYKPAHGHFLEARTRLGASRWLHAAQSHLHDIVPAHALGISNAWINRHRHVVDGVQADREFETLTGLADWLAP